MALTDNLATLKSDSSAAFVSKMETKYALVGTPGYDAAELKKLGDTIGELFAEFVMPYISANAELDNAALDDTGVTTSIVTGIGVVDDGLVEGGVK